MLERAMAAGVAFGRVTGDTVYGGDRRLRVWLEEHAIRHVLAVKRTEPLLAMTDRGPGQVPAEQLLAQVSGRLGRRTARPQTGQSHWPLALASAIVANQTERVAGTLSARLRRLKQPALWPTSCERRGGPWIK
jgi:hypothetical protein